MPEQRIHSVSVTGVVVDAAGRVLVIQRRDNGHWEPPGGVLERDETLEEGVVREVVEETGLTVEVEALTGAYKNMNRAIVALTFRCRPSVETSPAGATEEAVQTRWVDPIEVDALMDPAYAVRVHDALHHAGVRSRAHDGQVLMDDA